MQQRLSSPPSELKRAYDVVVVGSGYGGGVAASRLSRAGQRVCVIEKGKEFPTGTFPSRLPELRRELQLNGGKMRSGSRTGLFDFRLGADIHVLVGCGLGGGSLINAGVALKPDARVFADPVWPAELADDGLLELGFRRAASMLRPARYPNAPGLTKYRALEASSEAFGVPPVAAPVVVSFADTVNPAGVAQPACTLCGDCCSGCNVGAKNTVAVTYLPDARAHGADIFTELSVSHIATGRGRLARLFRAVERQGRRAQASSTPRPWCLPPARSARPRSCSDRASAGFRCPTGWGRGSRPMATSSPSPSAARSGSTASASVTRRNSSAMPSAPASRGRSSCPIAPSSTGA